MALPQYATAWQMVTRADDGWSHGPAGELLGPSKRVADTNARLCLQHSAAGTSERVNSARREILAARCARN